MGFAAFFQRQLRRLVRDMRRGIPFDRFDRSGKKPRKPRARMDRCPCPACGRTVAYSFHTLLTQPHNCLGQAKAQQPIHSTFNSVLGMPDFVNPEGERQ